MTVDGFRFLDVASRGVMKAWHDREPAPREVPWTPLARPLAESRVALISSAGIARVGDTPFDQEGERRLVQWALAYLAGNAAGQRLAGSTDPPIFQLVSDPTRVREEGRDPAVALA